MGKSKKYINLQIKKSFCGMQRKRGRPWSKKENWSLEAVMMRHVKRIKRICEEKLRLGEDDNVDSKTSEATYEGSLGVLDIVESMKASVFAKYLNKEREGLLKVISTHALRGAVMITSNTNVPYNYQRSESMNDECSSSSNLDQNMKILGNMTSLSNHSSIFKANITTTLKSDSGRSDSFITPKDSKDKYQVDDIHSSEVSDIRSSFISDSHELLNCISCNNIVKEKSIFTNTCSSCTSMIYEIMKHILRSQELACLGDPPCWSDDDATKCNACIIQRLMVLGLELSLKYSFMINVTVEQLRSQETVTCAREAAIIDGKILLRLWDDGRPVSEWCILSHDKPLSIPCQWNINFFKETLSRDQSCVICQVETSSTDHLYNIIPLNKHSICHECLLRVFVARSESSEAYEDKCAGMCSDLLSCNTCLLTFCQSIFPMDAIQSRYRRRTDGCICNLCGREDKVIVETLRSGECLCLVCMWKIRINSFSPLETCAGLCRPEDCRSCFSRLASCIIKINEVVTHNQSQAASVKSKSNKRKDSIYNKKKEVKSGFTNSDILLTTSRRKRQVKPTQFQDFVVGKSINAAFSRKNTSLETQEHAAAESIIPAKRERLRKFLNSANYDEDQDTEKSVIMNDEDLYPRKKDYKKNESRGEDDMTVEQESKLENDTVKVEQLQSCSEIEDVVPEIPKYRRIKQPVQDLCNIEGKSLRQRGPRVKQVTCQDVDISNERRKTLKKCDNIESKYPSEEDLEHDDRANLESARDEVDDDDDHMTIQTFRDTLKIDKNSENTENVQESIVQEAAIISPRTENVDVYRDSDSDGVVSEEENIDPDFDNINTVRSEIMTTGMAHDGGYPIVTSHNAMPHKVLCFSCGSGGDQLIHCVSCAEPFHFFCIEFQFRPKSKEMFVCRNCTKCHTCKHYGSDLRCIKCQLGFHPGCVDKYPPSHSEDRSNWVCYKCAMCLHCGIKAEDVIDQLDVNVKQIDWGKDPWQCGRCYRSRKDGHLCPECGRTYQTGLETVQCQSCEKLVHRQCIGLTEDEYEVLKTVDENINYECSKCESRDCDNNSRRHKGGYKKSDLKAYCEKLVTKRICSFIQQAKSKEEQIFNEYQLDPNELNEAVFLGQVDGINDNDDTDLSTKSYIAPLSQENNEAAEQDFTAVMRDSSESVEDFDMDQLISSEQENMQSDVHSNSEKSVPPSCRGIFSEIELLNIMSPKHMIMESIARIKIKLYKCSSLLQMYNELIIQLSQVCDEVFPWINFEHCVVTVVELIKKNCGRMTLIIRIITELVKDSVRREMEVFSSSVWDIEEKLRHSLMRGRDDFILFHSEQHLAALLQSIKVTISENSERLFSKYYKAFPLAALDSIICEKDMRRCILCRGPGDDGLEGRLIYGSQDVWVHVNCALWSDEVYEEKDGALVNVDAAIKRGRSTICASCSNYGATLRCSSSESVDGFSKGCANSYHFGCAFNSLTDPVFTESRTFYCSEVHETNCKEKQLALSDMLILRRIYIPLNGLKVLTNSSSQTMPAEDVVITIGTLRIDGLGTLKEYSDSSRKCLCPVDYRARRLFWSTKELDSLVMYFMYINEEPNKSITSATQMILPRKTVSAQQFTMKRQRMIDTVDSRHVTKKVRPTDSRHEVIYEMDDFGNLFPLTSKSSVAKFELLNFENAAVAPEIQKCNRRFPKENQIKKLKDSADGPLSVDHKTSVIPCITAQSKHEESQPLIKTMDVPKSSVTVVKTNDLLRAISQEQFSSKVMPVTLHQASTSFPISQNITRIVRFKHNNVNVPKIVQFSKLQNNPIRFVPFNQQNITSSTNLVNSQYGTSQLRTLQQQFSNSSQILPMNHSVPKTITLNRLLTQSSLNLNNAATRPQYCASAKDNQINTKIHFLPSKSFIRPSTIIKICPKNILSCHNVTSVATQPGYTSSYPSLSRVCSQSVLRNALTDNSRSFQLQHSKDPLSNDKSNYVISSCGSIRESTSNTFDQFDGEADEFSIIEDTDSSVGSVDLSNVLPKTTKGKKSKTYIEYNIVLKYGIESFTSSHNPKSVWTYVVRKVAQLRTSQGFTDYPLKTGDGWSKFGLNHRYVVFIIEQMVGAQNCRQYEFKYHKSRSFKLREQIASQTPLSTDGCRLLQWTNDQPNHIVRDPLAFLRCKSNLPPRSHAPDQMEDVDVADTDPDYIQRLAKQFHSLKSGVIARAKNVSVSISHIHSRGLFAKREFGPHDIIIEYVGETIRSILSDVREVQYQKSGVDCYMFRLDQDLIVDATYKGNAARFINHCCQPNCYAKVVKLEGEKHIIIIAQRRIYKGEELTYDYRFPIEEDKLACSCGSRRCRKFLN